MRQWYQQTRIHLKTHRHMHKLGNDEQKHMLSN